MTIGTEQELKTTREKLAAIEREYMDAKNRLAPGTPLSDYTLRSLRKVAQQLKEEILRYESRAVDALRH